MSEGQSAQKHKYSANDRICRNIIIHGHCRYENKGCRYNHEVEEKDSSISPSLTKTTPKLSVNSPEFRPRAATSTYEQNYDNKGYDNQAYFGSFKEYQETAGYDYYGSGQGNQQYLALGMQNMGFSGMEVKPRHQLDQYFFANAGIRHTNQPLQHHLYCNPAPHVSNITSQQKNSMWFFISEYLRRDLVERNEDCLKRLDPNSIEAMQLPREVHVYHSLYPIAITSDRLSRVFRLKTTIYKSIRSLDAKHYCLRRMENYRITNEQAISVIDSWTKIRHSGIVSVVEGFTTKAFGDQSLVVVYDYHPLSTSLHAKYFAKGESSQFAGIKSEVLFSYICQITGAITAIHHANLSVRVLDASKVLLTGKNRVRINCCGIFDVLSFDDKSSLIQYQQEDLVHFGQLVLALACGSLEALHDLPKGLDYVSTHCAPEIKEIIVYLLSKPTFQKSITRVGEILSQQMFLELDFSRRQCDVLEDELGRELENGRLFRLVCKLGFINERPEFENDIKWAETGDRYLLKLFRDYLFHQVSDTNQPVIDLAHVISCLNKLDVGVDERIMLMSRNEQSCLIVSYKDLKQCVETTFNELVSKRATKLI